MSKSNTLENQILDHVLRNTAYTSPTTVYLALSTADPTEAGSGMTEPSGNGYARQAITFGAAAAGQIQNTSTHDFTAAGGNWGTLTHFAIYDAVTAGNILYYGALDTARTINDTDTISFASASVTVTED